MTTKYAGSISIVDDQGNTVFERELTADEMVAALLEEKQLDRDVDAALAGTEGGVETTTRAYKKREKPAAPKKLHYDRGEAKPCCGSKGSRHYKWCKEVGGTGSSDVAVVPKGKRPYHRKDAALPKPEKADHGRVLTVEEWETVRDMHREGKNTMQMRNELGGDCSFQQINWAMLIGEYDRYVRHANAAK
jgi:hypothetical protein